MSFTIKRRQKNPPIIADKAWQFRAMLLQASLIHLKTARLLFIIYS